MKTVANTTFKVTEVERARQPLTEQSYKEAVEALLTAGIPRHQRRVVDDMLSKGIAMAVPGARPSRPVESCTRYHGRLLADVSFHPVVAAVHHAFMDHRPLRLSPDTIWLLICQGVANHINAHAEELRPRLVSHPGKIEIEVRRDDFMKGSPENPWPEIFHEFSAKIRDHVGPKIDLFLPSFSTTGPVERAASQVVLLDAVRSYFSYVYHTLCGIPSVTLEGMPEDWQAIAERARGFEEFGLESWLEVLAPILNQFVRSSQGDVDRTFWRSIYKLNDQSGGPVITGWVTAFFPYLKDQATGDAAMPVRELFAGGAGDPQEMLHRKERARRGFIDGPTIESFPGGLSKAPFRWNYRDKAYDMEFLGGFVGVAQDSATLTLRPEIGWAVRESPRET